jgi:viologen exporter family transport system permease protein
MSVAVRPGDRPRVAPPLPEEGRFRSMGRLYAVTAKTSVIEGFQYRVANYLYMIGMIAEPVIYLVVWSSVANSQGGSVGGFTPGELAAYYIVWTLVRQFNIVFTPYGWEWRIREGQLSGQLLRPVHPIHYDIAGIAGWKVVALVLWLPIAAFLTWIFRPTLDPSALDIVVFFLALWGAYLIRTMNLWLLGMVTFWTTRVSAIFELYFVIELLLSGRLVPLTLMPEWAQRLADFLPFKWTFGFPIESLVGNLSTADLFIGLAMQVLWIAIGAGAVALMWRRAVRKYSAVGN